MKKTLRNALPILLTTMIFGLTAVADSSNVAPQSLLVLKDVKPKFHPDRVIVKMKTSTSALKTNYNFQKTAEAHGLTFDRTIAVDAESLEGVGSSYAVMNLDTTTDTVEKAVSRLAQRPDVEYVQPDFIYSLFAVPNDTSYGSLWGLKNTAQTITAIHPTQSITTVNNPGTAAKDMDLETAWDTITDCSSVVVAVIDTGIKLDHEDIVDNLWTNASLQNGYDFADGDTDPTDISGHGTHVAGTIGARGNNGIGTTGVCWRVQLMALRVFDANDTTSTAALVAAVNFARTNGAHIINMSLGGSGFDQLFFNAIKTASDAGVLSVVAAGNDGSSNGAAPVYPCNYEIANVVCVGAVTQSFARADFSNYSTTYVDIAAPGVNIVSTVDREWGAAINIPLAAGPWTLNNANFALPGTYLQNPAAWDGVVNYANNQNDSAYTSVNLSGTAGGNLYLTVRGESQTATDYLSIWDSGAGGDPTVLTAATNRLARLSGSTAGALETLDFPLKTCAGQAACTVGFSFTSNATTTKVGFRIESLDIDPEVNGTAGYDGYNGTSMASPHVAGLAALVKARNPTFTAADLKNAVILTGTTVPALSSSFKYSSVANAPGALKYVDTPLGVSAAVVP